MKRLINELKTNTFRKLYVLYGAEKYLLRYYKSKLIEAIIPKGMEMNLSLLDEKSSLNEAFETALSYPFMHDKRLILFDGFNICKSLGKEDITKINELPEYCHIIFVEDSLDKRTAVYKGLEKSGALVEFANQDTKSLKKWICNQAEAMDMSIEADAAELLLSMTGDDMSNIYNELQKLFGYCCDRHRICSEDVRAVVVPALQNRIFEMISLGLKGRISEALRLYRDMLLLRESPTKVLILMNRQYYQLVHIKEQKAAGRNAAEIAAALKMNAFILKKEYFHKVDDFSMDYLKSKLKYGCRLEENLKKGEMSDSLAVELLLAYS